jgi:hypothetical protein
MHLDAVLLLLRPAFAQAGEGGSAPQQHQDACCCCIQLRLIGGPAEQQPAAGNVGQELGRLSCKSFAACA